MQRLEAARFLQALAHPKRLLLLALLADRAQTATKLAAAVGLPPGMVYKHLNPLVSVGILTVTAGTASRFFSISSPEALRSVLDIKDALTAHLVHPDVGRGNLQAFADAAWGVCGAPGNEVR